MLIVFPLGLLGMAAIFDIISAASGNGDLAIASYWMIAAGVITGLLSAVFGFIDWLRLEGGTRARFIGLWHGVANVVVVVLFIGAWLMRTNARAGGVEYSPSGLPLILEVIALVIALVSGWLGGELVQRLGVAVEEGAHPNAPSSLSGQPARANASAAREDTPRRAA